VNFARVAGNDAPLIGRRAATRGRIAMEGRDGRAGVKRGHSFDRQPANSRGERRDQGRAGSVMAYRPTQDRTPVGGTWAVPSSPTTVRRSSANAPQRGDASQTEGGGERADVKGKSPTRLANCNARRRTTRPGTRTLVDELPLTWMARGITWAQVGRSAVGQFYREIARCFGS
jgi:hypothetical protein